MRKTATTTDWIEKLKTEGLDALQPVYHSFREEFLQFGRRYTTQEEEILDVYQDAIVALYENVATGRLQQLQSSLKTYIFSIGKHLLINKLKRGQRTSLSEKPLPHSEIIEPIVWENQELSHQQHLLQRALEQLGGTCRELILLFYYEHFSLEAIAARMGYKNTNTAKAHKARCMKSLRAIAEAMRAG